MEDKNAILKECFIRAYRELYDYCDKRYKESCLGDQPYFKNVWDVLRTTFYSDCFFDDDGNDVLS